jgi:hypothetical protein
VSGTVIETNRPSGTVRRAIAAAWSIVTERPSIGLDSISRSSPAEPGSTAYQRSPICLSSK